jgi:preprotein translocase subunit SecG
MITLITLIHIFVCLFLIIVVLLQSGKSGDIAAAFGGQGSQTAFGPRGAATVLTKATTWCAVIFMLTSITLSIAASRKTGVKSVFQNYPTAPAKSGAKPAQNAPAPTQNAPAAPAPKK